MDQVRLGLALRALRRRRGWTQARLGKAAGLSHETVSRVERGGIDGLRVGTLVGIAEALDGRVDIVVRWHGESLDRLLDAAHATLVDRTVAWLTGLGWDPAVEVTFARYGERGAIDVLARHAPTGALLVVEVKSAVPDLQSMLSSLDRKARLAPYLAAERGWAVPSVAGRLLVLPGGRTTERRLAQHRAVFAAALPDRGPSVRAWLRSPSRRGMAGIAVPPDSRDVGGAAAASEPRRARLRGSPPISRVA